MTNKWLMLNSTTFCLNKVKLKLKSLVLNAKCEFKLHNIANVWYEKNGINFEIYFKITFNSY